MSDVQRKRVYYTVVKELQHSPDDNDPVEITTGHKQVRAYSIEEGEWSRIADMQLANYKEDEEELIDVLEDKYGKKYSACEFVRI